MFTDLIQQLLFYTNEQIVRFLTCICVRSQSKYGYLAEFRVSKSPGPNLHGRQEGKIAKLALRGANQNLHCQQITTAWPSFTNRRRPRKKRGEQAFAHTEPRKSAPSRHNHDTRREAAHGHAERG